jgi:molybdopterin-binding protein
MERRWLLLLNTMPVHRLIPDSPSAAQPAIDLWGLVTKVVSDTVMTQIEVQCGPHRVVSLMSTEAAQELDLQPGSLVVAVVKFT